MRRRLLYLGIALSAIPIGLIARSMRDGVDASTIGGFITTYLGDTLWAVMFFFLFAAVLVAWPTWRLALLTLCFTLGIELSQLYHGQPLVALRSIAPLRFLLGTHFLWSDIICLTVGSVLAVILHQIIRRGHPR